jgi:hypothetical protein
MNKILSTLLLLSVSSVNAMNLYQDNEGHVYTKAGEGRTLMGEFTQANQQNNDITIMKEKSEDFPLGKETDINMKFKAQDNKNMWLKMGVRIQGTFENLTTTDKATNISTSNQDAYLRRTRLEVQAGFSKTSSFVMDIRNDKVNYEDKGEQTFNVGDAYVKIKKPFGTDAVNFKLYRAKIDVSRTETIKSARVIAYDRPQVADEAAQYITHNRRGTNAQMYGKLFSDKVSYQVAVGDATYSGKMKDAKGEDVDNTNGVARQTFFVGGKVKYSPFTGWEEGTNTETYFGKGKHFTFGIAYWSVDKIVLDNDAELSRTLMNAEISGHYKGLFLQAEYFAFDGVIPDESLFVSGTDTVKSNGYYVTGEYVMPELNYIAPFFRYESWDKYEGKSGYTLNSQMYGVNWYLRGNTTKMGLIVQNDDYAANIGNNKEQSVRITTQWFF